MLRSWSMMLMFCPDFIGFYGKLPVRGEFLRYGLPNNCVDMLDNWGCASLAARRDELGHNWIKFWLEAPVWRFCLAPRLCGKASLIGTYMPSMDKAEHYFPLILLAGAKTKEPLNVGAKWLEVAEQAGLSAIAANASPDNLLAQIKGAGIIMTSLLYSTAAVFWWTEGAPYRKPGCFSGAAMPLSAHSASMLTDGSISRK